MSKRPELPRIGFEGSNDNMPFDRDQIYAHQGEAHPPIDDDALVENAVQNVNKGQFTRGSLNPHIELPSGALFRAAISYALCNSGAEISSLIVGHLRGG